MAIPAIALVYILEKRFGEKGEKTEPSPESYGIQTRQAQTQRVAHRGEEGYKERYVPNQGWMPVTPSRTFKVTLCRVAAEKGQIVLAASMESIQRDGSTGNDHFRVPLREFPLETTEDVERKIWRQLRINDAEVAIQLCCANGEPLEAESVVLDYFRAPAYLVSLSILRRCEIDNSKVILAASTLGDAFEIAVNSDMSVEETATKIRSERQIENSIEMKLVGPDGVVLPTEGHLLALLSTNETLQ
jgi:hypothetical protein